MAECPTPYYTSPMKMWEDHKDYFVKATPKEQRMNTYTITATASYRNTYTVEAVNEDEAISAVEWGDVDPDDSEFDGELNDVEVVDVEYGEVEYQYSIDVGVVLRGGSEDVGWGNDALSEFLSTLEGRTHTIGDGEIEICNFTITGSKEL